MPQQQELGISIKFESRTIFRNVRPVNEIISEFEDKQIPYIPVDPARMKYGNWNIVVAFDQQENYEEFRAGKINLASDWLSSGQAQKVNINPLKASKRAHGGKA